jgi:hypothetical protein
MGVVDDLGEKAVTQQTDVRDRPSICESRQAYTLQYLKGIAFLLNVDRGENGSNDNVIQ